MHDAIGLLSRGWRFNPARAFVGIDKLLRGGRYEAMGTAVKKSQ
jgi:hypothetical protein